MSRGVDHLSGDNETAALFPSSLLPYHHASIVHKPLHLQSDIRLGQTAGTLYHRGLNSLHSLAAHHFHFMARKPADIRLTMAAYGRDDSPGFRIRCTALLSRGRTR